MYMEQENDWDRDLLLDPAWEKQQRKVSDPIGAKKEGGWAERSWPGRDGTGRGVEVED